MRHATLGEMVVDRVTPRDIIDEILTNMEDSSEEFFFDYKVPGIYQVYLNTADYNRLEGLFPEIANQGELALEKTLRKRNRTSPLSKLGLKSKMPVENAQDGWCIEFHEDPNDELQPGEVMVESLLPMKKAEAAGVETQRVSTVRSGGESKTLRRDRQAPVFAKISYTDDRGKQTYLMNKPQITIGRGGKGVWVDLKIFAKADVSRKHLRLRFDQRAGVFYIKDLSTLGTTIDGKPMPSGVEIVGDEKFEKEVELVLPNRAGIGLAEILILNFESTAPK